MKRPYALLLTIAIAAVVAGGALVIVRAASPTAGGSSTAASNDALVASRTAQLDELERSLEQQLATQPPALPAMPTFEKVAAPSSARTARPVETVYVRASAPDVQAQQRYDDAEDEWEDEHEDEWEDEHASEGEKHEGGEDDD